MWDADTGRPIGQPIAGHTDIVDAWRLAPTAAHFVSGSGDKTLRLWDAVTAQQIGPPVTGHTDSVLSVAFSPDGRRILSGGSDGTVKVWPGPASWRDELCATLTQNMSHQQWSLWISPDIDYITVCPDLPVAPD